MARAKLQDKNAEFPMTKSEGMNNQMTKHDDVGSSSLELAASFVIGHWSFVISCCQS
jgi:hypothetical protein